MFYIRRANLKRVYKGSPAPDMQQITAAAKEKHMRNKPFPSFHLKSSSPFLSSPLQIRIRFD